MIAILTTFSREAYLNTFTVQEMRGLSNRDFNGVTYFADHMRGRTQDTRLVSAWFGDSDLLKRTAVNVALEMAGLTV